MKVKSKVTFMFAKNSVTALAVGLALSSATTIAAPSEPQTTPIAQKEVRSSYGQSEVGLYSIFLSLPGALDTGYFKNGVDRSAAIEQIKQQQQAVIDLVKNQDQTAIVRNQVSLVANMMHIQMRHDVAATLTELDSVSELQQMHGEVLVTEEEQGQYPYYEYSNPDNAVTVAIISSGLDYTHTALGGDGEADTYAEAWENHANAWDGFPTDTVIGGFDFTGEYGGLDYNPIERAEDVIDYVDGSQYIAGRGTMIGSAVLSQAPDAKLIALKTTGAMNAGRVYNDHRDYTYPAFELALDPNRDGNIDDRADVLIIENQAGLGFFVQGDSGGSSPTQDILLLRNIASAGTLVVTSAGIWGDYPTYFNIGDRGLTPEALTVGSVKLDGETLSPSAFTPFGPTRGEQHLKPDLVDIAEGVDVAQVGSGTEFVSASEDTMQRTVLPLIATGHAAGRAASLMASHPHLSALEVKALMVNTANSDVEGDAEVQRIGGGVATVDAAASSPALAYQADNYQPSLSFGLVELLGEASLNKDITIKNMSDETQTYYPTASFNGTKAANDAVQWVMPNAVNVPANHSVTFTVTLNIDGSKLPALPLKKADDYSLENWSKMTINGHLSLRNENDEMPELRLPWLAMPVNKATLTKDWDSESFTRDTFSKEWAENISAITGYSSVEEHGMSFHNDTGTEQTFVTLPIMRQRTHIHSDKMGTEGHIFRNLGMGVYDEARCESGKKLSIGVNTFHNTELGSAKHYDRIGGALFFATLYFPEMMDRISDYFGVDGYKGPMIEEFRDNFPELIVNAIWVELDENAQPVTWYLDQDAEFLWYDPTSRYRKSTLPTHISPNGNTAVANVCVDDLYHHDFNSPEQLNADLAVIVAADRDVEAAADENVMQFNPVLKGSFFHSRSCNPWYQWWCDNDPEATWAWNEVNTLTGFESALALDTGETEMVDNGWGEMIEQPVYQWANEVTLQPGEKGRFAVASDLYCNPFAVGVGEVDGLECYPGTMIINTATGYVATTESAFNFTDVLDAPLAGQAFSVYENAVNGDHVGTLNKDSQMFFGIGNTESGARVEYFMANGLPGDPFAMSKDGVITVNNADTLDYETQSHYTIVVFAKQGNDTSPEVEVLISVTNVNDEAPEQTQSINTIEAVQGMAMTASISKSFNDPEGDGIAYSSTDMPTGLTISRSGVILGAPAVSGSHTAQVTLSDGVNISTASVNFAITASSSAPAPAPTTPANPEPVASSSQSSGSLGVFVLTMLGLVGFMRRHVVKG